MLSGDIYHKAGCRARWTCTTDADITGWGIVSKLRSGNGDLIAELNVAITQTAPTGRYRLEFNDSTADWPLGAAYLDVLYTMPDGVKLPTETLTVIIQALESRP